MALGYEHSLGIAGGTVLDFTDWDKWIIEPQVIPKSIVVENWVSGINTRNLADWNDEGRTLPLPVLLQGTLDQIRASEAEIEAMLIAARNRSRPESGLDPVEYIERLNETVAITWWCKGGSWTPNYTLLGGNAMQGILSLELVRE